jgi:hypothetical protein
MNKIQEMRFIPRDLMLVMVGCHSKNVYPNVEAKMPIYEHAFAYQVAKSAFECHPINIRLIIEAMATQLNCNATANGLMYDWKSVLNKRWYNPELLQIISFHNSAGNEIANTTTIADTSILLPVVNGILAICRKPEYALSASRSPWNTRHFLPQAIPAQHPSNQCITSSC